jgi:arylsulfatase A-like enzyme
LLTLGTLAAAEQPNVLVILADDLGYRDVGFQGSPDIPTPNLDALAASGVRCTQGYVSSPVCAPSRAGLITGRNGVRFGFEFNQYQTAAMSTYGLPATEKTLADRLKTAGYRTGVIGKWHLGEQQPFMPTQRGFDVWHGMISGGHDYQTCRLDAGTSAHNGPLLEGSDNRRVGFTGHLTAHLGSKAVEFVQAAPAKPWFLYLAFNAPHAPHDPAEEDLKAVAGVSDPVRKKYGGLVVGLDRAVGRVMKALDESGQRERTLVFFLSDNGGQFANPPLDPRNKGRKRSEYHQFSDMTPLSGFKNSLWEGGVRVPFVVSWPGRIPVGTTEAPVWSLDIAATALAAAGAPKQANADGVDLLPFLTKATATPPRDELFIRYDIDGRPGRMLRIGPLKLLENEGTVKLFDVVTDPGEQNDLAAAQPQDVARLEARWQELATGMKPALWAPKRGDGKGNDHDSGSKEP